MPASKVPTNLFGGPGGVTSGKTVLPQNGETVKQGNGNTVKQEKVTFYLDPEKHSDKLDRLCLEYKKRTGRRINRQDVIRRLVENAGIEDLL